MGISRNRSSGIETAEDGCRRSSWSALDYALPTWAIPRRWGLYSPWGAPHVLHTVDDRRKGIPAELVERDGPPLEADLVELNRFHVFVDPKCFNLLSEALGYGSWRSRMRVPAICHSKRNSHAGGENNLSPNTMKRVREKLGRDAVRRSKATKRDLRVYVDDVFAGLVEKPGGSLVCQLPQDADVISVYGRDAEGDILLACHILTHSDEGVPLPSSGTIRWGCQKLSFEVSGDALNPDAAACTVRHMSFSPFQREFWSKRPLRWVLVAASFIVITLGVLSVYKATRPSPVFAVAVAPQPLGTRSVLPESTDASRDLISVPRGTRRIRFEVRPRRIRSGQYLVVLKVDAAIVASATLQTTDGGILTFELPAAKLKTGTYSLELSPMAPAGGTANSEIFKFQMRMPD